MKQVSYVDQLCERCGSKRKVAKTWKETMTTFTGRKTIVEYSQINCTNVICQTEFDESLAREATKRKALLVQKEENQRIRMQNSSKASPKAKSKKNKSRI